jgi:hypothetical protein
MDNIRKYIWEANNKNFMGSNNDSSGLNQGDYSDYFSGFNPKDYPSAPEGKSFTAGQKAQMKLGRAYGYINAVNNVVQLGNTIFRMIGTIHSWSKDIKDWQNRKKQRKELTNIELLAGAIADAVVANDQNSLEKLKQQIRANKDIGDIPLRNMIVSSIAMALNLVDRSDELQNIIIDALPRYQSNPEILHIVAYRHEYETLKGIFDNNKEKFIRNLNRYLAGMRDL